MKFLFDLGGVFFDWQPKFFFKDIFSNTAELDFFLKEVCNESWNLKQDAGRSIKDAENELIPKFPEYEKQIKMYYSNHRKMIKGTFNLSIEVLNNLKNLNYLCFVLSNWSSQTFIGITENYPFLNQFDGMIISGQESLIKPNIAIYNLAIKKFDLNPLETVFIDDKIENIISAKKLGFKTIHLKDPNSIKKDIEKFLII